MMHSIANSYPGNTQVRRKSFGRIPRTHKSSTRMNQVELQGEAYLCFAEDFSWFQGNINTNDESNYSIYGELCSAGPNSGLGLGLRSLPDSIPCTPQESEDEEINDKEMTADDSEVKSRSCYYKATLTDHFTGQSHTLPNLTLRGQQHQVLLQHSQHGQVHSNNESLFDTLEGQVEFKVMNVFIGQKADMIIQRVLGSPSLLGRRCSVYSGLMDIDFTEVIDYGKSWSL